MEVIQQYMTSMSSYNIFTQKKDEFHSSNGSLILDQPSACVADIVEVWIMKIKNTATTKSIFSLIQTI